MFFCSHWGEREKHVAALCTTGHLHCMWGSHRALGDVSHVACLCQQLCSSLVCVSVEKDNLFLLVFFVLLVVRFCDQAKLNLPTVLSQRFCQLLSASWFTCPLWLCLWTRMFQFTEEMARCMKPIQSPSAICLLEEKNTKQNKTKTILTTQKTRLGPVPGSESMQREQYWFTYLHCVYVILSIRVRIGNGAWWRNNLVSLTVLFFFLSFFMISHFYDSLTRFEKR